MAQSQISGVLEVPDDFKRSSLIGSQVRALGVEMATAVTIDRAYTLPRRLWEKGSGRKRVKFWAS